MNYKYLELNGYRPFALNKFDKFAITFTKALQILLGTNGSGKSSLLYELSPLPALPTSFNKGGSKIIHIEHHHRLYVLTSDFGKPIKHGSHSFVVDNEELNEGGTITVQRDLVYEHFKITADIHDMVHGRENFTTMMPPRRKEWFIYLCETNYDYAVKVYKKLKEQLRDAQGTIKMQKKKLVEESQKLIQSDEEEQLQKEAAALHECLNHLIEGRMPVDTDADTLSIQQQDLSAELQRAAKALHSLLQQDTTWTTEEILDDRLAQARNDRSRAQALMERLGAEYGENDRKIQALQKAEQQTIESLQIDIARENNLLQKLREDNLLPVDVSKPIAAYDAFQGVMTTLLEIFDAIPKNTDKKYSQQALLTHRERLADLTQLRANLGEKIQSFVVRKKHMEEHKDKPDLQCPSCSHRFSLNYNQTEYDRVCAQLAEVQTRLDKEVLPDIAAVEDYLARCSDYARLYRQYTQAVQSWPVLQPYWDYLQDQQVLTNGPETGLYHLRLIEKDLQNQVKQVGHRDIIADKAKILVSLKDVGGADLVTLQETNARLGEQLSEQTVALSAANQAISRHESAKERLRTVDLLVSKLKSFMDKKDGILDEQVETARRMHYNAAIKEVQSALATREHVLGNLSRQKAVVDSIAAQIADMGKRETALAILVKQMSPTEGLIAEGLLGFINNFIYQMNAFIKKIWSYSMVILPCDMVDGEGVDLDYKFPMSVDQADLPVPDVKFGSEGQKEIVNLAYRLIAMKYLHLQDTPLLLDEWGKAFDATHRSEATMVIKAMMEQHVFPQLFMVSHYEATYGALSNAEICVLNTLNVTVPEGTMAVNEHVVVS